MLVSVRVAPVLQCLVEVLKEMGTKKRVNQELLVGEVCKCVRNT